MNVHDSSTIDASGQMDTRWRPYPGYKDSGVEWLGRIPASWKICRLKHALSRNDSGVWGEDPDGEGTIVLRSTDMTVDGKWDIMEPARRKLSVAEYASARLRIGDLVVTKSSGSALHLGKTALVTSEVEALDGCFSNFMQRLRPKTGFESGYIYWIINSPIGREQLNYLGSTTTGLANLNGSVIGSICVPAPGIAEQRVIAAFLDRETAKIDVLMAKHERLIALLQEKRTTLISRAVTKGLDPNVPTKNPGIAWLGEIPRHWEVVVLKRLASIRYGLGQPPTESETGTPLIRATNVKHGRIAESGMMYVDPTHVPESRDAELRAGEIIVVRSGAYTGDSTIVPDEYAGAIAGYDMVISTRNGFSPYIAWQLLGPEIYELQFSFHKLRAAQPHLNAEELGSTLVVFPPEPEQRAITAYLDRETAKLDTLIAKAREMIERLQEYRTALISAAVTGKIDARGIEHKEHAQYESEPLQ